VISDSQTAESTALPNLIHDGASQIQNTPITEKSRPIRQGPDGNSPHFVLVPIVTAGFRAPDKAMVSCTLAIIMPKVFRFHQGFIQSFLEPVRGKLRQNRETQQCVMPELGPDFEGIYAGRVDGN
jgi:hypothetical protein